MPNWGGYFIRYRDGTSDSAKFPLKYIKASSWSSQPNFREEIKAYRDENTRNLTRVTAAGKKSSFSFETVDHLTLADVQAIKDYFYGGESDHAQRKIALSYWNDEDLDYKNGVFYRPNMEFKIKYVTKTDIVYDSLKLEFVEY